MSGFGMRGSPTQHGQQKLEALRASCFEVIRTSIVSATANYDKNCVAMHTKSPNPSCRVAWGSLFGGCVINGHARHANRTTPLIFGLVELFQIPRISKHSKKKRCTTETSKAFQTMNQVPLPQRLNLFYAWSPSCMPHRMGTGFCTPHADLPRGQAADNLSRV